GHIIADHRPGVLEVELVGLGKPWTRLRKYGLAGLSLRLVAAGEEDGTHQEISERRLWIERQRPLCRGFRFIEILGIEIRFGDDKLRLQAIGIGKPLPREITCDVFPFLEIDAAL